MQMSSDLQLAIQAAKAAGEIITKGFGQIKTINEKVGKGIITNIDLESERTINKEPCAKSTGYFTTSSAVYL